MTLILNDIQCQECGKVFEDFTDRGITPQCPYCGGDETTRAWLTPPKLDYLHMGVDARGNPTSGDKWARMHEQAARKDNPDE